MGITIILGTVNHPIAFSKAGPKVVTLDRGIDLIADVVLDCTGASSSRSTGGPIVSLGAKPHYNGAIVVEPTLQLPQPGLSHIFVAGDAAYIPGELEFGSHGKGCEKTAYGAEASGIVVAKNIESLLNRKRRLSLRRYPDNAFPLQRFPRLFVISLYKYDGILCLGPVVITGITAAVVKALIESLGTSAARGNVLAQHCFWLLEILSFGLVGATQWVSQQCLFPWSLKKKK